MFSGERAHQNGQFSGSTSFFGSISSNGCAMDSPVVDSIDALMPSSHKIHHQQII
jgi:hypothetical protein